MEQSWEWTFLKELTLVNTKLALNFFFTFGLLRKPRLSKMVSIKTNKNKNRTPVLKANFSSLETLFLGPRNAICLWLGLRNMASVKTNKNKNRTPLLKTNFSWLETLSLGPKRFLHSKGPKNAICLWLRLGKLNRSKQCRFDFVWYFLVSAKDKSHF